VTFYSAVFPFMKFAPDLLFNKWGMSVTKASDISSLVYFGTIFFTPFFGWVIDYKGKGASLMIYGSAMLVAVHLLLALTTLTPYVPMILLGITFSLVPAAMWPAIARIVGDNRLGTAYGLTFSVQNLGLFLFPILIGMVLDGTNPGVATAKTAGAKLTEAQDAIVEILGERELEFFEVAEDPPTEAEKRDLLEEARLAAREFAAPEDEESRKAVAELVEPYASRYREAQGIAARFAEEATLEEIEVQREWLDKASLGAVYDYTTAMLMLTVLGLIGMVCAVFLKRFDRKQGYGLDLPGKTDV
jgi:hypothetical protein